MSKSGTISEDLAVEVIGSTNAWYKAWVIDMFNTSALCTFENGWKNDTRVQFMRIRVPPEYPVNYNYALSEEVEVLSNTNPRCWWAAVVNLVSDDKNTFSIQYKGSLTGDLVCRDRIRPLISSKFLHPATFLKYSIEVPEKMRDNADIEGVLDDSAFKNFKEKTQASLIRYDRPTNMIIVLTPHVEVLRKVEKCFEYQLSLLESKVDILNRKKRYTTHLQDPVENQIEAKPIPPQHQFTDEFTIEPNFMGLAIGTRGKNINEARRIPGIIGLDLNEDYCLFKIVGETKEAVEKARNMLEYGDMTVNVDFDIASRVIGKKGNVVQTLIDRSGCVRVRLENFTAEDGSASNITKFIFTGTKQALKDVDILMDCATHHARETIALNEHNKQADSMLRNKIYNKPPPRTTPLMTPRAPITPPYPNNELEQGKKITPTAPVDENVASAQKVESSQTYLQTPTVQEAQTRIQRLTIETQTEPLDDAHFIKPAPPPPTMQEPKQEDTRAPSPRMPLQKRTSYPPFRENNSNYRAAPDNNAPRETYRMNVRDPSRRTRENVRDNARVSSTPATVTAALPRETATRVVPAPAPRGIAKPVHQKPKVDIKLVNEKIGSALGNSNKVIKVEDVTSEQQAAIEDLVKAEANKVTIITDNEDKENNQKSGPVNNQNIKVDNQNIKVDNQNIKVDNQVKKENDNVIKEQPMITIQANEALVCEFSPAS